MRRLFALLALSSVLLAACGGDAAEPAGAAAPDSESGATGLRLLSVDDAAAVVADPPQDLVVLDVRTAEEFSEGHLEGAAMLDFYRADFAERLAELDPDVPYVVYCRSGNRSGQTVALMEQLGFSDVIDVDGGITAWHSGGHPIVGG